MGRNMSVYHGLPTHGPRMLVTSNGFNVRSLNYFYCRIGSNQSEDMLSGRYYIMKPKTYYSPSIKLLHSPFPSHHQLKLRNSTHQLNNFTLLLHLQFSFPYLVSQIIYRFRPHCILLAKISNIPSDILLPGYFQVTSCYFIF